MCKWLGIFVMPIMYTSPLDHQVNIISSENYLFRVIIRYATIVTKQSISLVNNIYLVGKHNKATLKTLGINFSYNYNAALKLTWVKNC